jgi:hypothetical protein
MANTDTLTIYWAPASYISDNESWATLYREPVPILSSLRPFKSNAKNNLFACPAIKDGLQNVFSLNSAINDAHTLPKDYLQSTNDLELNEGELIKTDGNIFLTKPRKSSLKGYSNLVYNMKWVFFAEESVIAKFSAPYFPSFTPAKGSILSSGKFDIGRWPRFFNLDYHIPLETETFIIKENDPFFYIEIETFKTIIFKQCNMSQRLIHLCLESSFSPNRYGKFKSLKERYEMATKANIKQQVITEMKKNLIEK